MRRASKAVAEEAPEQPVEVGATVAGLRIERVIARHPDRYDLVEAVSAKGKHVALKVFPRKLAGDEALRRRVLRLAALRASIDQPLLPVLGALELDGGRLALAHALPRGDTLAEVLREGPLDPREAVALLSQVAGALESARALGLPQGELTPRDILVTGRPRQALLIDFGIGSRPGRGAESEGAIDAVGYRPPEAIRGAPREPAGAVYSLACILVECLTGAPPFPYDRPLLTLHAHLVEAPPRVSQRRERVPAELDGVVASGLNKRPQQRFASPAGLMRAAQRAIGVKAPIPVPAAARQPVPITKAAPVEAPVDASKPDRKSRESAGPPRAPKRARRRYAAWPAPAAAGVAMALLASTAGFAFGHARGGSERVPSSTASRARVAPQQQPAYARAVGDALARLKERRVAVRQRLRSAHRPAAQAAEAAGLATAYGDAGAALARESAPQTAALRASLAHAQHAYRNLATAARRHDSGAFGAAGAEVLRRENEVTRAIDAIDALRPA